MHCCTDFFNLDWWVFLRAIGGYRWLAWPQFAITPFPNIASSMQAPQSGASSATAAPAAEETPKAAVPSEAQSSGLDIDRDLSRRSFSFGCLWCPLGCFSFSPRRVVQKLVTFPRWLLRHVKSLITHMSYIVFRCSRASPPHRAKMSWKASSTNVFFVFGRCWLMQLYLVAVLIVLKSWATLCIPLRHHLLFVLAKHRLITKQSLHTCLAYCERHEGPYERCQLGNSGPSCRRNSKGCCSFWGTVIGSGHRQRPFPAFIFFWLFVMSTRAIQSHLIHWLVLFPQLWRQRTELNFENMWII